MPGFNYHISGPHLPFSSLDVENLYKGSVKSPPSVLTTATAMPGISIAMQNIVTSLAYKIIMCPSTPALDQLLSPFGGSVNSGRRAYMSVNGRINRLQQVVGSAFLNISPDTAGSLQSQTSSICTVFSLACCTCGMFCRFCVCTLVRRPAQVSDTGRPLPYTPIAAGNALHSRSLYISLWPMRILPTERPLSPPRTRGMTKCLAKCPPLYLEYHQTFSSYNGQEIAVYGICCIIFQ
jgi:hypothetical protein